MVNLSRCLPFLLLLIYNLHIIDSRQERLAFLLPQQQFQLWNTVTPTYSRKTSTTSSSAIYFDISQFLPPKFDAAGNHPEMTGSENILVRYMPTIASSLNDDNNHANKNEIISNENSTISVVRPVISLFTLNNFNNRDTSKNNDYFIEEILKARLLHDNNNQPHTLRVIDVNKDENRHWLSKYRYDLPILHMGNRYWMKGRELTPVQAENSLLAAMNGMFQPGRDEPNWTESDKYQRSLSSNNITKATRAPVRKRGSGDFQKMMVKSITSCDLLEE